MHQSHFTIKVDTTAPGANTDTTVLFNSITAFGLGGLRHLPLARIEFELNNSHSGTLALQRTNDGGTNWRTVDTRTVNAPAAGTTNGPYDYLIDGYHDVRLTWTNGGTAQDPWEPTLKGIETRNPGS